MSPRTPPAKPRRDAAATRAAILAAARRHFAEHGYEHAGVREIAAGAGVTAALVNRYFGGKEQLFREALEDAFVLPSLLPADRGELGQTLAGYSAHPADRRRREVDPVLLIVRSMGSPVAGPILREQLDRFSIGPLAEWIGGGDAELRAALVVSCMAGVAVLRKLVGSHAFQTRGEDRLAEILAPVLQACINGGGQGEIPVSAPDA